MGTFGEDYLQKNPEKTITLFCAHMEYKRPDVGLKIYREAPERLYSICARKKDSILK